MNVEHTHIWVGMGLVLILESATHESRKWRKISVSPVIRQTAGLYLAKACPKPYHFTSLLDI
jgi:hypothetical protein